jgi:signal transduction histidine kinase
MKMLRLPQSATARIAYPFRMIAYSLVWVLSVVNFEQHAGVHRTQLYFLITLAILYPHLMHWLFAYLEKNTWWRQHFLLPDALLLGYTLHVFGLPPVISITLNAMLFGSHIALRGKQHLWVLALAELLGFGMAVLLEGGHLYISPPNYLNAVICSVVSSFYCIAFGYQAYRQSSSLKKARIAIEQQAQVLQQQKEKLEALTHKQIHLMQTIAHDLKNPLHNIMGLLEVIRLDGTLNQAQQEAYYRMMKVVEQQKERIHKILSERARHTGQIDIQNQRIAVHELLHECVELQMPSLKKKKLRLFMDFDRHPLYIQADRKLLMQVIENLLSNAIKYSPPGKSIGISSHSKGGQVIIGIRDEGPGIPEEEQQLLFKRFQKLSPRPTQGEDSSGLGLFIAKNLTEQMGGRLSFKSKEGKGTTFYLLFPEA